MTGLAAGLSASEDREFLAQLNVDTTFEASPTFEASSAGHVAPSNTGAVLSALHNFAEDLFDFDAALYASEDGIDETFFDKNDPVVLAIQEAGGVPWPTPWSEPSDWQISSMSPMSSAPASLSGFEGGVFRESLEGLGVASTIVDKNARKAQFRAVAAAAFNPGTKNNQVITKKLLEKSVKLADLAEKRASVTKKARDAFQSNLRKIQVNDQTTARLYGKVFDAAGKLKPGASNQDVAKLFSVRRKNIALGRDTVRLQKLNLLASAITQNTLAQITSTQLLAQAVAAGAPEAVPALGLAFDKLGRENAKIKQLRAKQIDSMQDAESAKTARDGTGLSGFDALYSLDVVERPFDSMEDGLAALEGRIWRKAKRRAKKAVKKAGGVVKEVGKAGKTLVKATVVAPIKGTAAAAKAIAKGDVKGAFKAVGMSVVNQAKGLKDFAAQTLLKWPCDIANTKAFKAGVQAVGQAVGTAVGSIAGSPTIGGAVGTEAGGQAANIQRNTCGAMKTVGLTKGTFRPGRIKEAAGTLAKKTYNQTLSPKAQLASLKRIAMNSLGGQYTGAFKVGGVDVMSKIGLDPNKLVAQNPLVQNLYRQGTQKLQTKLQAGFQKGAGGLLKKTGIPGAQNIVGLIQSGNIPTSMPSIQQLTAQGERFARQQAASLARRNPAQAITRVVPSFAQATGIIRGNASQADLLRIAQQLAPATVVPTRGPIPMLSRYVSQPTDDAWPYVGSIGREQ